MFSMKDYLLAGFFCSKCFNIIDGNLSGIVRTCENCNRANQKHKKREKEKV